MSIYTYLYSTLSIPELGTKLIDLENKLTIDLDLNPYFLDCIYNMETFNIVINFSIELSQFLYDTLTNICQIVLYDGVIQQSVYIVDYNNFNRRSFNVINPPTNEHDLRSGYSIGSVVTLNNNDIYICTDNTMHAAVWQKMATDIPQDVSQGVPESSALTVNSTSVSVPPMYLNYTQKDGKGLEVVNNSMFFSNNEEWQNLACFTAGINYKSIILITYHKKGGKIRIIETKSNKVIAESNDIDGDMIKTHRKIDINETLMYTIQGKQIGTGIHSIQLF
jgi:hypothetical protein